MKTAKTNRFLVAAAAAALALAPRAFAVPASQQTRVATIARAIDRAASSDGTPRAAAGALVADLQLSTGDWLDVACLEVLSWRGESGLAESVPLAESHLEILQAGIAAVGARWSTVRPLILERANSDAMLLGSLRAAGRLAPPDDVLVLAEVCGPFAATRSRALRSELQNAVATWCGRHALNPGTLRAGLEAMPPAFAAAYVQGALAGADRDALMRGIDCLGVLPTLDAFLLARLSDLAETLAPPFPGLDARRVEDLLHSPDPSVVMEATRLLRALDSVDSASALISLLERAQDPGIQRSAVASLERISGERLGPDARTWRRWHNQSERWVTAELPRIRQEVESTHQERVHRALLEIARQRAHRHRTGPIVINLTRTKDVARLETAIAVLGQLSTRSTIRRLIQLLDHDELAVQRAAYRSLRHATGRDLGADPSAWRHEFVTRR